MRVPILMLLIVACAHEMQWRRPGSSQQEFHADQYQCSRESQTSWAGGGTGLAGQLAIASARAEAQSQADDFFKMCMQARGWYLVDLTAEQERERNYRPPDVPMPPPPPKPPATAAYGHAGDACGPLVPCVVGAECVEGRCAEGR